LANSTDHGAATRLLAYQASTNGFVPVEVDAMGAILTSASYQGVVSITPGSLTTPGRAIGYVCTAAGNITLDLVDGSSITLPISTAAGAFQVLPFAVSNLALGTGTAGQFWNLK